MIPVKYSTGMAAKRGRHAAELLAVTQGLRLRIPGVLPHHRWYRPNSCFLPGERGLHLSHPGVPCINAVKGLNRPPFPLLLGISGAVQWTVQFPAQCHSVGCGLLKSPLHSRYHHPHMPPGYCPLLLTLRSKSLTGIAFSNGSIPDNSDLPQQHIPSLLNLLLLTF